MLTLPQLEHDIDHTIAAVDLEGFGPREQGKVRDIYRLDGRRILITTDRVSAFDRVLDLIPHKGQVLNQLSAFWFHRTRDIVPNHAVAVPDPNVTVAREAKALPVEMVVRGYITGVTTTSLWYLYKQGERRPYGVELPDGLQKNDPLPEPIITPTTKAARGEHDRRLTRAAIVGGGMIDETLYEEMERVTLALFARGQAVARQAGLVLVDTKYEFGLIDDELTLIDEIHTPDSSRYWLTDAEGKPILTYGTPEHYDKEFMRQWYAEQGYRGDGEPPQMPREFVAQVAQRYMAAYEKLTGETFVPGDRPVTRRIARNLATLAHPND